MSMKDIHRSKVTPQIVPYTPKSKDVAINSAEPWNKKYGGTVPVVTNGLTGTIATGVTVAHNLGVAPSSVLLTATDGTPSAIYVSDLLVSTFTVNYAGGGTHAFYWVAIK